MLKNAECGAIIQVIGAGSGRTFDIDAARYGKIIMMTDADVDGSHIRTLLLTLFHRYMRPMVEAGRVFAAVPPLHRIELVQPKKGQDKYVYTYSDRELRDRLMEFQSKNIRYKDSIQRYKGLGEMDADQLAETTMDPRRRTLRRINLTDLDSAEQVFDLLMGNDVAPRKEFISSSAATLGLVAHRRVTTLSRRTGPGSENLGPVRRMCGPRPTPPPGPVAVSTPGWSVPPSAMLYL
ncbi:DNA gyrase subunit B [Streptomyces tendae]